MTVYLMSHNWAKDYDTERNTIPVSEAFIINKFVILQVNLNGFMSLCQQVTKHVCRSGLSGRFGALQLVHREFDSHLGQLKIV